jgi:hypothetical protein
VFVSGQGPLDPVTKQIVSDDIGEQTRVTLDNVRIVLEAAGSSVANIVKVGDMKGVEASPPRAGVNVEIDAIAWISR